MTGRAEVYRLKQRLDATFQRVQRAGGDSEVQSDFAKYLCVLVSGYLKKAVAELVLEHARIKGAPTLQRFVEKQTKRFTNAKAQRLQDFLGGFDPDWRRDLESFLVDERKAAVDSVVAIRNQIAHGESVDLTYRRIGEYYEQLQLVVGRVSDLCAPTK